MIYNTKQENFWAGQFGTDYIDRNNSVKLLYSKMIMWEKILKLTHNLRSVKEYGCSIGLNLQALKYLNPKFSLFGYEINKEAIKEASNKNIAKIYEKSIIDNISDNPADLTFTCGVLIHINPDFLANVYSNLVNGSNRYIVVAEYYNPSPISVTYRGHKDKLFKRDFAGELIDKYKLNLIDYGFIYKNDKYAPQDDITWFLMEK